MKNFYVLSFGLALLINSINAMDTQPNDELTGITAYQREKLKLKKEKLAIQKREQQIRELDLLAKTLDKTMMGQMPEVALMRQMFFEVALNDIFFENYQSLSDSARNRVTNAVASYKNKLAEDRQVSVENVFDSEVQAEAEYQQYAAIIKESEVAARRIMAEKNKDNNN